MPVSEYATVMHCFGFYQVLAHEMKSKAHENMIMLSDINIIIQIWMHLMLFPEDPLQFGT